MTDAYCHLDKDFCRQIGELGKTLAAHAEDGVGPLCREIARLREIKVHVQFPASRIVIGSDYPLFDKDRHGDYMCLAHDWVTWKTDDNF